jgi:Sec-independent protein translocase protein TatA
MEIFGVGGAELIAILIVMLVVAGPKRMIRWAYILGQYTAKLRVLWAESMAYLEKEFRDAGVDVNLPRDIPTKGDLSRQIGQQVNQAMTPVTKPVQDVLGEVQTEVITIKEQATIADTSTYSSKLQSASPPANGSTAPASDLGTWSGQGDANQK